MKILLAIFAIFSKIKIAKVNSTYQSPFSNRGMQSNPEYSAFLHDHGYVEENRPFRLFVYSLLEGKYEVKPPHIIFSENITFELRSPMNAFCDIFYLSLMHRERFFLNKQEIFLTGCVATKRSISEDNVTVRTLSPICMNRTVDGKTVYLSPDDGNFSEYLNNNFLRKYRAATDSDPTGGISVEPVSVGDKDKYVTKFDNRIYVTAWKGIYRILGSPENLNFLYDCGLGGKNSQGFGMVEQAYQ